MKERSCRTCKITDTELCTWCLVIYDPQDGDIKDFSDYWSPAPFWTPAERAGLKAMGAEKDNAMTIEREMGVRIAIESFVRAARAAKERT